jgi:hypothetical protein
LCTLFTYIIRKKQQIKINFTFSTVTEYDLYSKILRNSLFNFVNILLYLNTILHITRIKVVHKNESQSFYKEGLKIKSNLLWSYIRTFVIMGHFMINLHLHNVLRILESFRNIIQDNSIILIFLRLLTGARWLTLGPLVLLTKITFFGTVIDLQNIITHL